MAPAIGVWSDIQVTVPSMLNRCAWACGSERSISHPRRASSPVTATASLVLTPPPPPTTAARPPAARRVRRRPGPTILPRLAAPRGPSAKSRDVGEVRERGGGVRVRAWGFSVGHRERETAVGRLERPAHRSHEATEGLRPDRWSDGLRWLAVPGGAPSACVTSSLHPVRRCHRNSHRSHRHRPVTLASAALAMRRVSGPRCTAPVLPTKRARTMATARTFRNATIPAPPPAARARHPR